MEKAWQIWKKGFDAWEGVTAGYLDQVLRNPAVLSPAGAIVGTAVKAKGTTDRLLGKWWGTVGLPSRGDQERALYVLTKLESKLCDLEERLAELETER